jgi:asparagine synthase (glutamine-hydrolysing)
MCGIAGQIALHPRLAADPVGVQHMLKALIHRGPDSEGFFVDPSRRLAMGSRRLAVIDLVSGQQPVTSEDGSVVCVFNGEIYGFEPLRRELERRGHTFRSSTDTEVIVHLYEDEGIDLVRHLRGMFAFALWDQRRQRLVLGRDRLGKKPLYYLDANGRLAFASEINALYALPDFRPEIDPQALDLYLTYSYVPAPLSIFRSIRKLLPGHLLIVQGHRVEAKRYWRLAFGAVGDQPAEDLVRAVRAKIEESVQLRLVSDVPVGCFLSGGVDSSSVVAVMSRLSPKPIKTFSIGFGSQRFNELPYARAAAKLYGTDHFELMVCPDAVGVVGVLPEIARHFGEPYGDASAVPTWYLARLARQHVTVALTGDGGDELFGGYDWYRTGLTLDRLARSMPRGVPALLRAPAGWLGGRPARLLSRLGMAPGERFASLRQTIDGPTKSRLYSPKLLDASRGMADAYVADRYDAVEADPLRRMQHTDIVTYLPEDLLVKADRMTMAHSLEARSPLLDHELAELAATVPPTLSVDAGGGKALLKRAVRDLVPHDLLARPKQGFSVPLAEWLAEDLQGYASETVDGSAFIREWLRPRAVQELLDKHTRGQRDCARAAWNLLMLAEWSRLFAP